MNDSRAPTEIWISTAEIARRTGKSTGTVQGLLHAGIIPAKRHGSRWYVQRSDFERWLAGQGPVAAPLDVDRLAEAVASRVLAAIAGSAIALHITPAAPAELREVRRAKGR